jgi:glycosyltransferase involved in cell wall biosynthesis
MLDPYFQKAPERRLKAIRNQIYWKLIEQKLINRADGLLFTCEAELLLARETFTPYHPKRELNVGYGIQEPPAFTPAMRDAFLNKCPEIADKSYILFLSRVHEKKGADLLIKAYSSIRNSSSSKLIIAGPGMETDYGKSLIQIVKEDHLEHSVHFTGMLSGDAKWGAFYGCETFVLPSHQENFGIAVVEALAPHAGQGHQAVRLQRRQQIPEQALALAVELLRC